MIIAAIIALYLLVIYLSFTVNVFQFGLYLFDNAEGEAFDDLDETKRLRLNILFDNLPNFNHFVMFFDNFTVIVTTAAALAVVGSFTFENRILYLLASGLALILTLTINLVIAQTLSKRVPNKWVDSTLKDRLSLVRLLFNLFNPFVSLVNAMTEKYKREQLSEEQKEDMVERAIESLAESAGLEEPLVEEDEKEMIGNIFELDQTTVIEIMVPRTEIIGIPCTADFEEIQKIVIASGHSRFPVFEDDLDKIRGIMYVKDMFGRFPLPKNNFNLLDYLRTPYFVPDSKLTSDLLNELKITHNHMAIVIDEYGGTSGLITMEDVIEIIVGDIQDEHDIEEADIVRLNDSSFRVDANVSVEKLAEFMDIDIENPEFETVGGLIYDLVGSLPRTGQVVSNDHFEFHVEKIDGQRIDTVIVKLIHRNSE
jgi:CBS domain containing-hemolysin-like protein